jgi:histidinol-phosphate aminotransferase
MRGYVPGEQPQGEDPAALAGFIKLNTNENPYGPSPKVLDAIRAAATDRLRLYPDPTARALRTKAAEVYGLPLACILAGNGSDDLLTILVRAFVPEQGTIASARPDYLLYKSLAEIQGARFVAVDVRSDESAPEAMAGAGAKLVLLSSPNNPTGAQMSNDQVRRMAEALAKEGALLVVDEAYVDFAPASCLTLVAELDNLVVLRSFSKSFSLAGLRIGLAFGPAEIIAELLKVKDSYNLDRIAIAAATAALDDLKWMRANVATILRTRRRLAAALERLGFDVQPSAANFLFCRVPEPGAKALYEALKAKKILVRHFGIEPIDDAVRISAGTDEEIDALLKLTEQICS